MKTFGEVPEKDSENDLGKLKDQIIEMITNNANVFEVAFLKRDFETCSNIKVQEMAYHTVLAFIAEIENNE